MKTASTRKMKVRIFFKRLTVCTFPVIIAVVLSACGGGGGGSGGGALSITKIKAGNKLSAAIRSDGTLWVWGSNGYGQFGDGTSTLSTDTPQSVPVRASGFAGTVTAVSLGGAHTVALKSDGTVWTCGMNNFGQLGDTTNTNNHTPAQVGGLTGAVTAVAAGFSYTVALKSDGTVWAWGLNYDGQLGDGTTTNSATPLQVSGLTATVTAVAAGSSYTVALKSDGTVWAWGNNTGGQLGDGTTASHSSPAQVSGLTGTVTAIAAGTSHTVALKSDGTVWAWGYNPNGQLGDGMTTYSSIPVPVGGLTGVTAISAGTAHTVALKNDGTVWAWGGELQRSAWRRDDGEQFHSGEGGRPDWCNGDLGGQ